MGERIDDTALDTLFREARTHTKWQPRPVDDEALRALYELLKWAPTSANAAPARFAFLRSKEAKERLRPALAPLNVEKTMTAPVTVIVAYDMKFYEQLPKLFPHSPGMAALFASNPEFVEATAKRNSSLQGAYLIMAARALERLGVTADAAWFVGDNPDADIRGASEAGLTAVLRRPWSTESPHAAHAISSLDELIPLIRAVAPSICVA